MSLKEKQEELLRLIVDSTDYAFSLKKCSDDAGMHFHLYLDNMSKEQIDLKQFRLDTYKILGYKRFVISFVSEDYIKTFLN